MQLRLCVCLSLTEKYFSFTAAVRVKVGLKHICGIGLCSDNKGLSLSEVLHIVLHVDIVIINMVEVIVIVI